MQGNDTEERVADERLRMFFNRILAVKKSMREVFKEFECERGNVILVNTLITKLEQVYQQLEDAIKEENHE